MGTAPGCAGERTILARPLGAENRSHPVRASRLAGATLSRMGTRRSLTDSQNPAANDVHATRRGSGGARRERADRVLLRRGDQELTGWALNLSRGGVRLITEEPVELGESLAVLLGDDEVPRAGRVVWVQEEQDGMVVGVEFLDGSGHALDSSDVLGKGV